MTLPFPSSRRIVIPALRRIVIPALSLVLMMATAAVAQTAPTEPAPPAADAAAADVTADATTSADATVDAATATDAAADASTSADAPTSADAAADASTSADASADADAAARGQAAAGATLPAGAQADVNANSATAGQADLQGGAQLQGQAGIHGQAGAHGQSQPPGAAPPAAGADGQADLNVQSGVAHTQNFGLQFGQPTARGLTLNAIDQGSVFFNSGLQPRDVLVSVHGQPVRTTADFQRFVALYPGQRVPVAVWRGGRQQTIHITPPPSHSIVQQPAASGLLVQGGAVGQALLGVTFDAQIPNAAVVRSVNPGSAAEQAGLQPGDMINALNGQRVGSPQHVVHLVSQMQPGQQVQIDYSRRLSAAAVLGGGTAVPHSVGYAPEPAPQTVIHSAVPAPSPAPRVIVDGDDDNVSRRPQNRAVVRPGDADRDGRILDGDGRIGRNRRQAD